MLSTSFTGGNYIDGSTLSPGEQYLKYTGKNKIRAQNVGRHYQVNVYEAHNDSELVVNATKVRYGGSTTAGSINTISYYSYLMVPQTNFTLEFSLEDPNKVVMVKGMNQLDNIIKGRMYTPMFTGYGSGTFADTVSAFDEYFVVFCPESTRFFKYNFSMTIDRTSYDFSGLTQICVGADDKCVIGANRYALFTLEEDVSVEKTVLFYTEGLTAYEITAIVCCCVCAVIIVVCAVLMFLKNRKKKKADEETGLISNSNTFMNSTPSSVSDYSYGSSSKTIVVDDSINADLSYNSSINGDKDDATTQPQPPSSSSSSSSTAEVNPEYIHVQVMPPPLPYPPSEPGAPISYPQPPYPQVPYPQSRDYPTPQVTYPQSQDYPTPQVTYPQSQDYPTPQVTYPQPQFPGPQIQEYRQPPAFVGQKYPFVPPPPPPEISGSTDEYPVAPPPGTINY